MSKIPSYLTLGLHYADQLCQNKTLKVSSIDRLSDRGFICDEFTIPLISVTIKLIGEIMDELYTYEIALDTIIDPELKEKWQKD